MITGTKLFHVHMKKFGLDIHLGRNGCDSKTKAMFIPACPEKLGPLANLSPFEVDGNGGFVQFVDRFNYLGSWIHYSLDSSHDVHERIKQAKAMFAAFKATLTSKKVLNKAKGQIYNAIIMGTLLYGCEAWRLKSKDVGLLTSFHRECVRQMCRVSMHHVKKYRIKTADLEARLGIRAIDEYLARRILTWFGKVARMGNHRLPKLMLSSWVIGSGSSGSTKGFTAGLYLLNRAFKKVIDNPAANCQLKEILQNARKDKGKDPPVQWEGSGKTRTYRDWNWIDLAQSPALWEKVKESVFNGVYLQQPNDKGELEDIGVEKILIKDFTFSGISVGDAALLGANPPNPFNVGVHPPSSFPPEWSGGSREVPIVLQFDGGSRGNPGVAGAGFSISWNPGGMYRECTYGYSFVGYSATNNVAEYTGFVHGLQAARDLGVKHLRIQGDSKLIVDQVNRACVVNPGPLLHFYNSAHDLLQSFTSFSIEHIERALNGRADHFANLAMDTMCTKVTTLWSSGFNAFLVFPLNPLATPFDPLVDAVPFVEDGDVEDDEEYFGSEEDDDSEEEDSEVDEEEVNDLSNENNHHLPFQYDDVVCEESSKESSSSSSDEESDFKGDESSDEEVEVQLLFA